MVEDWLTLRALPNAHEWIFFPVESRKWQEMMRALSIQWSLTEMHAAHQAARCPWREGS